MIIFENEANELDEKNEESEIVSNAPAEKTLEIAISHVETPLPKTETQFNEVEISASSAAQSTKESASQYAYYT
jgi:hypothetical protein